uniref:Uncharacterized protein n=4 Tax=Aegilops tauschii subsp. strangulata TaxID=200361 RepID=A0A453BI67_AEGTS
MRSPPCASCWRRAQFSFLLPATRRSTPPPLPVQRCPDKSCASTPWLTLLLSTSKRGSVQKLEQEKEVHSELACGVCTAANLVLLLYKASRNISTELFMSVPAGKWPCTTTCSSSTGECGSVPRRQVRQTSFASRTSAVRSCASGKFPDAGCVSTTLHSSNHCLLAASIEQLIQGILGGATFVGLRNLDHYSPPAMVMVIAALSIAWEPVVAALQYLYI